MRKVVDVAIVVAIVVALLFACNWAWDHDSSFQLSPAYDGHHSYISE